MTVTKYPMSPLAVISCIVHFHIIHDVGFSLGLGSAPNNVVAVVVSVAVVSVAAVSVVIVVVVAVVVAVSVISEEYV